MIQTQNGWMWNVVELQRQIDEGIEIDATAVQVEYEGDTTDLQTALDAIVVRIEALEP
jgi:hypothetical protein